MGWATTAVAASGGAATSDAVVVLEKAWQISIIGGRHADFSGHCQWRSVRNEARSTFWFVVVVDIVIATSHSRHWQRLEMEPSGIRAKHVGACCWPRWNVAAVHWMGCGRIFFRFLRCHDDERRMEHWRIIFVDYGMEMTIIKEIVDYDK